MKPPDELAHNGACDLRSTRGSVYRAVSAAGNPCPTPPLLCGWTFAVVKTSKITARLDARKIVRDPVHGLIEFRDKKERQLFEALSSKALQRLRLIKQCGFAELVFPSLCHSRFEHALGSYHVMRQYLSRLEELWATMKPPKDDYYQVLHECRHWFDKGAQFHLKVAALLHDFGHPPFSHATDDFLGAGKPKPHERWALRLLDEGFPEQLSKDLREEVRFLLNEAYDPQSPSSFEPKRQLLSSPIDVDRIDYLARDCYHGGVTYAQIDMPWLLRTLEVSSLSEEGGKRKPVLCYHERRGRWFLDALLSARRTMYVQVYLHRVVVAATSMYRRLLARLRVMDWREGAFGTIVEMQDEGVTVGRYLNLHDAALWAELYRYADGELAGRDAVAKRLASGLVTRQFFYSHEIPALDKAVGFIRSQVRDRLAPVVAKEWGIPRDQAEPLCDINEDAQRILGPEDGSLYTVSVSKKSQSPSEARPFAQDPEVGSSLTREPYVRRWLICPREVAQHAQDLIGDLEREKRGGT